ncbi:hypothetical protein JCM8547_008557 [Rhodosporidiobolus lusitaniae]
MCGACEQAFFCSRNCQILVWSVHKVFCEAGGEFVHPPLASEEVFDLKLDRPYVIEDWKETMLQRLKRYGLYEGSWEFLLVQMQLPRSSCGIADPKRTAMLISLRLRLTGHVPLPQALFVFHAFEKKPADPTLFSRAAEFMKQQVLDSAICLGVSKASCDVNLLDIAYERPKAMLFALDVDSGLKGDRLKFLDNSYRCTASKSADCPHCRSKGEDAFIKRP